MVANTGTIQNSGQNIKKTQDCNVMVHTRRDLSHLFSSSASEARYSGGVAELAKRSPVPGRPKKPAEVHGKPNAHQQQVMAKAAHEHFTAAKTYTDKVSGVQRMDCHQQSDACFLALAHTAAFFPPAYVTR